MPEKKAQKNRPGITRRDFFKNAGVVAGGTAVGIGALPVMPGNMFVKKAEAEQVDAGKKFNFEIPPAPIPEKDINENPVLEYCNYIVFEKFKEMKIERPEKFGGDLSFSTYKELEEVFEKGELHPMDLKQAVGGYINELIDPVSGI